MAINSAQFLPFTIGVLLFFRDREGRFLLIKRKRAPNLDCWSPVGGKLEMTKGESPFECAIREAKEETDIDLTEKDLHLFGSISEKNYEGIGHWLLFLFDCHRVLEKLPSPIEEGSFGFFSRTEINSIKVPKNDIDLLWFYYDKYHRGFVSLRAQFTPGNLPKITEEEGFQKRL